MKKVSSLILVAAMVLSVLSGCSSSSGKIETKEDFKNKTMGTITWYGVDDSYLTELFSDQLGEKLKSVKSFDSEASLMMALDTGKVDVVWLRDFQANAYVENGDKYTVVPTELDTILAGSARMAAAVNTSASADLSKINDAIASLKADGTLAALEKEYVDSFSFSKNYDSIELPVINGAPTYNVCVSGSMAPLDYIAADGKPTGFCIALLSKISEIAQINFNLVTSGIGTDRLELTSGKVDYIFCYTLTDANMEKETEMTFSDSYYSYNGTSFLVKK